MLISRCSPVLSDACHTKTHWLLKFLYCYCEKGEVALISRHFCVEHFFNINWIGVQVFLYIFALAEVFSD